MVYTGSEIEQEIFPCYSPHLSSFVCLEVGSKSYNRETEDTQETNENIFNINKRVGEKEGLCPP